MILGAIAMMGIIGMQSYWVISTWGINEDEFNSKVNLALYRVARTIARLNGAELPPRDIIKQRTSNYYIVNVEDEINASTLEFLLQKELESLSLQIDFEYGIYDCHTREMVYGGFCKFTPGPQQNVELGNLPKDSEFTYYFGVKFPTRSGYLLGRMQLSIFLTLILLVTLSFFVYSMWVILRQKRMSEMQKDFINNMTHEFKTPLSTIKIAAGVFANNPEVQADQRLLRYAHIINEQNERLNKQVEKVLHLARIEEGNFEMKPEPVLLHELLSAQLRAVELRLDTRGGKLYTNIDSIEQLSIRADRMHLGNILHNLLDNAIKYGGRPAEITVTAQRNGKYIDLSIADNGAGIPKEHQARVFEKFYRVPTGNVHNVKGFGLGLYYVKHICAVHRWEIQLLDNPVGTGTVVQLRLGPIL